MTIEDMIRSGRTAQDIIEDIKIAQKKIEAEKKAAAEAEKKELARQAALETAREDLIESMLEYFDALGCYPATAEAEDELISSLENMCKDIEKAFAKLDPKTLKLYLKTMGF